MVRKKNEASREPKLLRVGVAAHELGLHPFTVRRWIRQGKIQAIHVGLEARIPRSEIERLVGKTDERVLVLYARVSGQGQRDDLDTQIVRLEQWAKETHPNQPRVVLSDIGSGLSTTRKQLGRLLKMVCEDRVAEIAITYSDRLTRFGQDYLAVLFESFGVTLIILNPDEEYTPEQELTQDLLALIASFSGRLYGRRSHTHNVLVDCAKQVIAEQKE
jgi:excisionase family DNA binding protein